MSSPARNLFVLLWLASCASTTPEGDWSPGDNRWWKNEPEVELNYDAQSSFPNINTVPPPAPAGTYPVLLKELKEGYKEDEMIDETQQETQQENQLENQLENQQENQQ